MSFPVRWTGPHFKHSEPSRLEEKAAAIKDDKKAEAEWKRKVWARDKGLCRVCGCKVHKTLTLEPKRGECHHIKGRSDNAVRWDVRNGVLVDARCHERIERNQLVLLQPAKDLFTVNGKQYLDGSKRITFKETK